MKSIVIQTKKEKEVVDITGVIDAEIDDESVGLCHVFVTHTTAALTTADLDPGTDLDMLDAYEALVPKLDYRHPHDPTHMSDHLLSSLVGTSVTIPVVKGKLFLGRWQRLVLIEFNGPRDREVLISTIS